MWLDIIKTIIDISTKKKEIQENKQLRISEIFLEISKLLDETSNDLENNIYPIGSCFKMTSLSEDFLSIVKNYIAEETFTKLENMLYESCRLEREYANRTDKETINVLRKTAAAFYTQSLVFKIK